MNAICRSFPKNILSLLKGDTTTGDNKLCTTLFCIASGLKKLSQTTPLPESRCIPSPLRGVGQRRAAETGKAEGRRSELQRRRGGERPIGRSSETGRGTWE
jgi:hypothetical protein